VQAHPAHLLIRWKMPPVTNRVRIINQSPTPSQTGVLITATVVVEFNLDMEPTTLTESNVLLLKNGTDVVDIAITYDEFRRQMTLTPSADLDPGTKYYVLIRGTEDDEDDSPEIAGVLGVDDEPLIGYYSTFFTTEFSALDAPVLSRPPIGAAVSHIDIEPPDQLLYWNESEVYATDTTTTPVAVGAILADTYIINNVTVTITARTTLKSSHDNAIQLAAYINASGAPIVASANANGTITLTSNATGSDNPVVIESVGTYDMANLSELGTYMANPLAPPGSAYVVEAEDVTYQVQIAEDSLFSSPEVDVDSIEDLYYTPGAILPTAQLYWRVRAKTATVTSSWSEIRTFYNGIQEGDDITDGDIYVSPIGDPFLVTSHSPVSDSVNNYNYQITITFNEDVYVDSVTDDCIEVIGKSLLAWESDVGEILGTCELQDDGRTITFTPTISWGATISWAAPPSTWNVDTIRIYRSTSKDGVYTLIDTIYPSTTPDYLPTTYTDTSVVSTDQTIYWYRVEFLGTPNSTSTPDEDWWPETTPTDELYNAYPQYAPIMGRTGGFMDNQIYRVTVSKDIYSSSGSTTTTKDVALGQDYTFYFTSKIYPLYATITELETVVGPEFLTKFSTIDVYSMLMYNSYSAYHATIFTALTSPEYTLEQFVDLDYYLGLKRKYFTCYVVNKTAYDMLKRVNHIDAQIGRSVQIGDFKIADSSAGADGIDPRIEDFLALAQACLMQFSNAFYNNVATWAIKASPMEYYGYPPYAPPYERRSWWSDSEHPHRGY